MSVGQSGRTGSEQVALNSSEMAGALAGGTTRGSGSHAHHMGSGMAPAAMAQLRPRLGVGSGCGGTENGGPHLALGNPATALRTRSLSLSSSTPIGVSTTLAIAGSTSQGDSAGPVSSADTAGVRRMEEEEGEVADPLDPSAQSGVEAAGPTGSSMTPTGTASDRPPSN